MDTIPFDRFGIMVDCSRNAVMNLPTVKKWIDTIADLGYNTLMLYTEDTYEVPNQPYFGYLRGRYSAAELQEIDRYAASKGVELIPCIQTLAHLNAIFRWNAYTDIRDCDDILLADSDKTYQLIEDMFTSLEQNFTSRTVNIGMDEAHMLGRGRYKDLCGDKDGVLVLLGHLNRVSAIAKAHGFEPIMWGDMFFRLLHGGAYCADADSALDEVRRLVPDNVHLVYWDYYSHDQARYDRQIKAHASIKEDIWFAGGLRSSMGFVPHNGFSEKATKAAFAACRDNQVRHVILTMWGDNGGECSRFALLPSLYYASELAKGHTDDRQIKQGFAEKYGVDFDTYSGVDLPGTPTGDDTRTICPEKYMLYSDLFSGIFDASIEPQDGQLYGQCARMLKEPASHPVYGYVFETLAALCETLSIKWDLGIRTRAAYQQGDKAALQALLDDYRQMLSCVQHFYTVFKRQWMTENKPYGFEVQDIRFGGLMQRIVSCQERLESYISGQLDIIPELEETILPYAPDQEKAYMWYNRWDGSVSANCL